MRVLRAFNDIAVRIGSWGTILFMGVIGIVIPYEVAGRYLFGKMTIWSGEVAIYSLAWASMLGGAVGLRKGYQVAVTSVVEMVPDAMARMLRFLSYLFSLVFFGVMFGWGLYQTIYNLKQTSPAMGLVMSVPYAALPTGFLIMFFVALEEFLSFLGIGDGGSKR
ncbi:MAG: TRAP transporter small permease [Thermodesulfobacteriota bacterium]